MTMEALPQDLADFLVTRNFDPEYFNKKGDPSEASEATTMKFDYVAGSGKNYGTAVCVIADDELSLFYGDNLGRGMEPEDKQEWFDFLEQLSNTAASHGATWSPTEINKLKHTLAGIAAIKEGLFEGYYGNRKVSYMGEQTQARLVINHNRVLGENDKRYRYVESLYIETADQERFRLPFKSLAAGRAMLEHVRQGGRPYDIRGNHITEIVSEMAVLSRFNRAQHHRVYEGVTQELVESAQQYYHNLQETMKHLGSPRGYRAYFESWAPDQVGEAEALVENLRDLFVEQTLDARIEAALPTLAKIQKQGNNMKEAQIFENWVNQLSEGTWALPETPEQMEKLNQLMSGELIVGPDATNATEQLYDIVGDDELFDILNDLADRSEGRANVWDDSDVQRRLAELGIQTPQSTQAEPADVEQDTAPPMMETREIRNKKGRLLGTWDGRVFTMDPETEQIWAEENGPEWVEDFKAKKTAELQQQSAPSEDMIKYYANELEKYDVQAGQPRQSRQQYYDLAAQMVSGALAEGEEADNPKYSMSNPGKLSNDEYKDSLNRRYGQPDLDTSKFNKSHQDYYDRNPSFKQSGKEIVSPGDGRLASKVVPAVTDTNVGRIPMNTPGGSAMRGGGGMGGGTGLGGRKPGDDWRLNMLKLENADLARMLQHAGVPLQEGVLTDSTGSTLEHIKDTYKRDVKDFMQTGEMSRHLEQVLYDYYYDDMPYGAKTGEDIDTSEWISDRFAEDLGMNENLITPMIMPVSEGSCNMTMEGSYCPEHGLAECGGMYEDEYIPRVEIRGFGPDFEDLPAGKKLINPMQPRVHNALSPLTPGDSSPMPPVANVDLTVDEGNDDPINSNSAITGSYYEGKEYQSQEGDALLARIKSLALLK